jgi:NAD(P)-dependent dehydrogenase (short-subunit alcohol dehydrogenase family)
MAVNYLGHFLLTHLILPCLEKATEQGEQSRVVSVSSCTHEIGQIRYDDFNYRNYYRAGMAYADSKLAQVMFSKELQRVFDQRESNVQSHAVHPGKLHQF